MSDVPILPSDYQSVLLELKDKVNKARYQSLKSVNRELINLYWDVGKMVNQKTQARKGIKHRPIPVAS